jgi:hypothetical protein
MIPTFLGQPQISQIALDSTPAPAVAPRRNPAGRWVSFFPRVGAESLDMRRSLRLLAWAPERSRCARPFRLGASAPCNSSVRVQPNPSPPAGDGRTLSSSNAPTSGSVSSVWSVDRASDCAPPGNPSEKLSGHGDLIGPNLFPGRTRRGPRPDQILTTNASVQSVVQPTFIKVPA